MAIRCSVYTALSVMHEQKVFGILLKACKKSFVIVDRCLIDVLLPFA